MITTMFEIGAVDPFDIVFPIDLPSHLMSKQTQIPVPCLKAEEYLREWAQRGSCSCVSEW
jgi:hypothetical protein